MFFRTGYLKIEGNYCEVLSDFYVKKYKESNAIKRFQIYSYFLAQKCFFQTLTREILKASNTDIF